MSIIVPAYKSSSCRACRGDRENPGCIARSRPENLMVTVSVKVEVTVNEMSRPDLS